VWSYAKLAGGKGFAVDGEIYFSIVQRTVLLPNDFTDLNALAERLPGFQYYWETTGEPFEWKFTRQNLADLLVKLGTSPLATKYVSELLRCVLSRA
jgi:hypothetical protein